MADQSELPRQVESKNLLRKQALRWPGLVKKWGFADGSHLKQSGFPQILEAPPPAREVRGGGGWSSASRSTPEQHGTAKAANTKPQDTRVRATVSLAAERITWWAMDLFKDWSSGAEPDSDNFIEQLKQISATVESEVMDLWDGTEPRAEIFEPECRRAVKKMLLKISEEFSDKARNAELSRLDVPAPSQATCATETQKTVPIELAPMQAHAAPARPTRRGYRAEIDAYRRTHHPDFTNDEQLAKKIGVSYDMLKMVKSDKPPRCKPETEKAVLDKMNIPIHQ
jgi:hypothetical protein